MAIKIGNIDISAFKVGSSDCSIYLGDTLLYSGGTTPPTPTLQWVTFNTNDDITGLEIYGLKGKASDLEGTFVGSPISFTAWRTYIDCAISNCYSHTYDYDETVELIFSNVGCNDYYTSNATTVVGNVNPIQLYIYA